MEPVSIVITGFICLVAVVYWFVNSKHNYWRDRGVAYAPDPNFFYGHVKGQGQTIHGATINQKMYQHFKQRGEPYGGMSIFLMPSLVVVDPELVKTILVKDFNVFHDRGVFHNAKDDPLSANLFNMEGNPWRLLRQKLTPTFTSGRMKQMFGTIWDVARELEQYMEENHRQPEVEMKDILGRFTTDVIGTCAFGIECNTLKAPDSEFRKYGLKALELDLVTLTKFIFASSYPNVAKKLGMRIVFRDVEEFFMNIVRETVNYRETNNIQRNDFMNLLLQIKNMGKLDDTAANVGKGEIGMTQTELAAQVFIFFLAGFETSSTTQSFCLYELAKNPDIQERLREEINSAIDANGGEVTYDTVMNIQYLDQVINETLRKYPPVDTLTRKPARDYVIPGTKHVLPEGMIVQIPVYAIQRDPDHYPDPDRFDPDRFLPEEVKKRHPYVFLPFGEGPRICIGLRFGVMQTKVGLITLLRKFRFSPSARTPDQVEFDPRSFTLSPTGGNYLKVEKV
ncbi:probable cytochrome P450 6a13 [Anopheles ziemanni]|uniref:probable cytochrome P450 6a13 n=1 Tax=Anopheles coustani TaxID=139045 RepID=UPI002657AFB5|nr:probable cytochrome P450 6a13 [Anopheles coustani]XP_058174282.1 probable cytochrome P450 6a13 [Anopheles ziemanni]